jgi:uncharacterized protein YjbI with pentapeptide repeats
MPNSVTSTNSTPNQDSEKLLESANSASQTVAALHVAFLAFVAYLGVIVWGTSHEDLLRISPVKLPILDVELPLTAFYNLVPWMVVLLHFNLLMQLELLSCKLWNLDRSIKNTPDEQQVRDRLFIFPFTHLIVGRSNVVLIRWMMSLVVGITVIALPLFMLLAAQIRFLPFHDEAITWSQRLAVWVDAVMLMALWPLIASPRDKAMEWWQNAGFHLFGFCPAWLSHYVSVAWQQLAKFLQKNRKSVSQKQWVKTLTPFSEAEPKGMIVLFVSVPLIVFLSLIAVVPGSTTVRTYFNPTLNTTLESETDISRTYFEDWLIKKVPSSWLSVAVYQYDRVTCTTLPLAEKTEASILQVMLGSCGWFDWGLFPRNLDLKEARLVPKEVSLSQLTRATDSNKQVRDNAFKEFDGLNLQNRDLRFANLFGAVLPKADLRHVQLQGAVLLKAKLQGVVGWDKTQLQGAILGGTQLQGAGLIEADLRNADLRGASLQATDLSWANLQSADLRGADLQGANLQGTILQGADLRGAKLQGSTLREANLQGASLDYTKLIGTDMGKADLQGVVLYDVQFLGVDWLQAKIDGIYVKAEKSLSDSNDQINTVIATLKPLLDAEKFTALRARINDSIKTGMDSSSSQMGCFSENPALLGCNYSRPEQLTAYRLDKYFPTLIELACSDVAIASGIARRNSERSNQNHPNFGLATALLKAMNSGNKCIGLTGLSEQTKDKLKAIAEQEKIDH